MVAVLRSDTGRSGRARRLERNCPPGRHGHGHVQPRSCDADLGARLRLAVGRMFYVRRQLAELLVERAWMDFDCAARNSSDTYS
jgi:hypothetical protein